MHAWTKRAGSLARKTFESLGSNARTQTTPTTRSTPADERDLSAGDLPRGQFVNPVGEGADPSVVRDGERFLWCQAEGNVGVSVWVSDRLTSMGTKHVVWMADPDGPCSKEVWAPELIELDGRWHIYFAASDGQNRNHRTFVLVADTDDALGPYTLHGPLFTGDEPGGDNLWSIDFTVLEHGGRRFGIWSGWPDLDTDLQHLYAAELVSPTEIKTGRVRLAEAGAFDWERVDETSSTRGLLEGPRVLAREGRTFIVYSCAASWLDTYKLGLLELTGADPLEPSAWTRSSEPVFDSTEATYGVGHGCFVSVGDAWWHVFHSKIDPADGWRRTIHVQPMKWSPDGRPDFGRPLDRGAPVAVPAGSPGTPRSAGGTWTFADDGLSDFDYYGHHQFYAVSEAGLDLGCIPAAPVNDFRSAEKVVLRDGDFTDVRVQATFSLVDAQRSVGVLFRVTGPAVGIDAQRGYYACLALDTRDLLLGRSDGRSWKTLATTRLQVRADRPQTLTVTAQGDHIEVSCAGATIDAHDDHYTRGSAGVRVVDSHARFSSFAVTPL